MCGVFLEGRKVGIELTELFVRSKTSKTHPQQPLLQAVEGCTDWIVCEARKIYLDAGNPPVRARILFSHRITLDKKMGNQLAKLIAHKIESGLQSSQLIEWTSNSDEREEGLLCDSVVLIHARGVPELRSARWTVARAGWVAPLTPKHLQDRINEKAKKINGYKKNTEEIWLLIVTDRTRPSQKFMRPADFPIDSLSSPFARTFYYGYAADDEVIEF